ncbi:hypothetical protein [Streptomyces sp. NRRL S-1448]|uniref:hypothetical protein n=1 Tax=Streptomyces sp. NRRL S-1448 TaxID=1463883 RepID=UPI0004BEE3E2|nr:hypothetical protein [Streptomyces sp. NRRL S-1448]
MGASGWRYVTPYQSDFGAALRTVRAQVLASGEYFSPTEWGLPAPASPGELFENPVYWEFMGTSGTHSVLDVDRVIATEEEHDFGTVRPLSVAAIRVGFGSDQPSLADFNGMDPGDLDALEEAPRWSGHCMALYEDGVPCALAFWGVSGD